MDNLFIHRCAQHKRKLTSGSFDVVSFECGFRARIGHHLYCRYFQIPGRRAFGRPHLEDNHRVRTSELFGHGDHGLVEHALHIDAQPAEPGLMLEDLEQQRQDAAQGFAGAGGAGDQEVLAKGLPVPDKALQPGHGPAPPMTAHREPQQGQRARTGPGAPARGRRQPRHGDDAHAGHHQRHPMVGGSHIRE